ncbi:MAG: TIGR02530 family flagellar biosynthesis protein [Clostridium sp.]|uniref:TIGR02530 family flagellar biosynthesis protein n=1 Tax=Clostridium sp. TaxID=1506 RepID=UPI003F416AC8
MGYRMINGIAVNTLEFGNNTINHKQKESLKNECFKKVLDKQLEKRNYIISKHAEDRLKMSNLNEQDMKNIEKGFKIAEDKGSKNSLMLYKDLALITSIENRTVITAIQRDRAKENIYTNIDSVVVL